jgi:hypothetical protein
MDSTTIPRDLLFTLLLKVGVASSIAALLARWNTFRTLFAAFFSPKSATRIKNLS